MIDIYIALHIYTSFETQCPEGTQKNFAGSLFNFQSYNLANSIVKNVLDNCPSKYYFQRPWGSSRERNEVRRCYSFNYQP